MIKHVFVGVIKEGVDEAKINERLEVMRAIDKYVPQVSNLAVGRNLNWYTQQDALVLTGDFNSKEDWLAFINSDYHQEKLIKVAGEVFDMEKSLGYEYEF